MNIIKTYSELISLQTFEDRYRYLKVNGTVGESTFGSDRYINQLLYTSKDWLEFKDAMILRDNGCDLGCEGYDIPFRITLHHINPLTRDDIIKLTKAVFDPENVITTSHNTHLAIHYGDENLLFKAPIERFKNDVCPWRIK